MIDAKAITTLIIAIIIVTGIVPVIGIRLHIGDW